MDRDNLSVRARSRPVHHGLHDLRRALFTQTYVLQLDTEPADVRQTKLGVPWLTAITAMPHGTVTEPDSFAVHWNRRHREVIVVNGSQCGTDLISRHHPT